MHFENFTLVTCLIFLDCLAAKNLDRNLTVVQQLQLENIFLPGNYLKEHKINPFFLCRSATVIQMIQVKRELFSYQMTSRFQELMVLISFCGIKAKNCIKMGVCWVAAMSLLVSNAQTSLSLPKETCCRIICLKTACYAQIQNDHSACHNMCKLWRWHCLVMLLT